MLRVALKALDTGLEAVPGSDVTLSPRRRREARAQETAHLAMEAFAKARNNDTIATVFTAPEIRERYFGTELEGESDERYAEAWKIEDRGLGVRIEAWDLRTEAWD